MKKILFISALFFLCLSFGFKKKPSLKSGQKFLESRCVYIPSGNAVVEGDTTSVQAFYMSQTEVTNFQYREFLNDLKRRGEMEKYKKAELDTAKWVEMVKRAEPYMKHYHSHPAYNSYPVVNVPREGAKLYCEWLSEKCDSLSGGELKLTFRVPKREEWIRGARGDKHYAVYAWGGPYVRNNKGYILANFVRFGSEHITWNAEKEEYEVVRFPIGGIREYADVTAPAQSFWPNDFGLYNMNGNVSEMIDNGNWVVGGDWRSPGYDIRNESKKEVDGPHPTVGFRVVATYLGPPKK